MNKGHVNYRGLFTLLGIVLVVGAWRVGALINTTRLNSLPVIEAPKVDIGASAIDAKSFYPAWIKQPAAQVPAVEVDSSVDDLFQRKDKEVGPAAPNYLEVFQQTARIDGVSDGGVFVNGRFYRAGEKMAALAIQGAGGGTIIPVVKFVTVQKIVFGVGEETVTVRKR